MAYDCYCEYDPPTFARVTKPKARKSYRCEECDGFIVVGEQYEYTVAKWYDSGVDIYRTCERCHDIRVWLSNNLPCFCWAHGGMFETAIDDVREAQARAPDEAQGLLFGYYRRIIKRDRLNASRNAVSKMERAARLTSDDVEKMKREGAS